MPVPSWKTEWRQLTPKVHAYVQGGGPGVSNNGVSNAGLIVGGDAAMIVDALQAPIPARAFLAAAKKTTDKPLRHLVNTHFHGDHVGGNQYFTPIQIIATPETRDYVMNARIGGAPGPVWPNVPGRSTGNEPRVITLPWVTFKERMTVYYEGVRVELYAPEPAHSAGDVLVHIPEERIVFAGDCCFFYVAPHFWTGAGTGSLHAFDWLASLDVDWIVPGHGPIGTKKELQLNRQYVERVRDQARVRFDKGMNVVDAASSIDMGEFKEWIEGTDRLVGNTMRWYKEFQGDPFGFISSAERAVALAAYRQKLGLPPPAAGQGGG